MGTQQILDSGHVGYMFPMILPLIAASVGLIVFYYYLQNRRLFKLGNLIPGKVILNQNLTKLGK